ncbi:MAG: hypothetical protein AB7N65_14195 [Vicinamibacterales bacterium]
MASRRALESQEMQIGQDGEVGISLDGDAALDRPDIEVVDGPRAMQKADELAFMEEKVLIQVAESTDPNAENPITVAVNGRNQFIWRGVPTVVKRKFVERLARAKSTSYAQDVNTMDPTVFNKLHSRTALQYPFTVLEDRNPKGADWLRKVLAEA